MRAHPLLAGLLAPAAIAGALAFTAASPEPAQAKAPTLIHSYGVESVSCVPAAGGTVRAKVNLWMRVVNYHGFLKGDWANHMTAKVRLEATTPGWNYSRVWKGSESGTLVQDHKYKLHWGLLSDNLSPRAEWQVHVKLTWDRPFPTKNVVKDFSLPFNANCADPTIGGGLIIGRGGS